MAKIAETAAGFTPVPPSTRAAVCLNGITNELVAAMDAEKRALRT